MPAAGPTTAAPSIGPVTSQVSVAVVVWRSSAIVTSETDSSVTVTPVAKTPASEVARIAQGLARSGLRAAHPHLPGAAPPDPIIVGRAGARAAGLLARSARFTAAGLHRRGSGSTYSGVKFGAWA